MMFYQDLQEGEKLLFRRRVVTLVTLANLALVIFTASYALGVWGEFKALVFDERRIEIPVTGEGKISARPDVARIHASVVTRGEILTTVQVENTRKSESLVAYLKGQGISDADIKTAGYNIYPQYSYPPPCQPYLPCPVESQQPKIIGYEVRNSYEVTIRDLTKANAILGGVVAAGANEVYGINFTIDEPEALRAEARREAIREAEKKAVQLAKDLGKRLGKVVSFTEGGSFPPPIFYEKGAVVDGRGGGGPVPVEPGEQEVIVTVTVVYEFW